MQKLKRSYRIYDYQQKNVDWVKALGADRVMIIKLKIIKRLQIIWIFFDTGMTTPLMLLKSLKKVEK
jgi:hypothetical protein